MCRRRAWSVWRTPATTCSARTRGTRAFVDSLPSAWPEERTTRVADATTEYVRAHDPQRLIVAHHVTVLDAWTGHHPNDRARRSARTHGIPIGSANEVPQHQVASLGYRRPLCCSLQLVPMIGCPLPHGAITWHPQPKRIWRAVRWLDFGAPSTALRPIFRDNRPRPACAVRGSPERPDAAVTARSAIGEVRRHHRHRAPCPRMAGEGGACSGVGTRHGMPIYWPHERCGAAAGYRCPGLHSGRRAIGSLTRRSQTLLAGRSRDSDGRSDGRVGPRAACRRRR